VYLDEIAAGPSAYDEVNVRTIASFAGLSEEYLLDALIRKRNYQQIDRLHQTDAAHPIQIAAS
jgi:hypothetical protein